MEATAWVTLDPTEFVHLHAQKVAVFRHEGRDQILLVQEQPVPNWTIYAVLHIDEDGVDGLEAIDGSADGAEGKQIAWDLAAGLRVG